MKNGNDRAKCRSHYLSFVGSTTNWTDDALWMNSDAIIGSTLTSGNTGGIRLT